MKYTLTFAPRALSDLEKIKKSGDQARIKKLRAILDELTEHPLTGVLAILNDSNIGRIPILVAYPVKTE